MRPRGLNPAVRRRKVAFCESLHSFASMRLKRQSFYLGIILAWCTCGDLFAEPMPKVAVAGLSADLHGDRQKAYQELHAWAEKNLKS